MNTAIVRIALLLPTAGAVVFAGIVAVAVPTAATDWARAGAILAAALVQAEITRRMHTVRRQESEPHIEITMAAVWSLTAALAVHLTLAIALVLVLHAYRYLRERQDNAFSAGVLAWSLVAAHFAASFGAWATPSLQPNTSGVLAVAAAVAAHLAVNYALATLGCLLRYGRVSRAFFGRAADIGLKAALLTIGAITGALTAGTLLVVVVAIPVVVTLHNAALTQQLEVDASVDKKTGLANAGAWQAHAERTFADAAQDRGQIGVLMVDLDLFKRLNDTYGHHAGDDVLAAVGACLRSQLRQSDLGGRFGGEEFTVLLPATNIVDTMTTAERIRIAISELRVSTVNNDGDHVVITDVTASIGAATYPHHGTGIDDCLRVADNHVYQAKRQGRNTVVGISTENITPYQARPTHPTSRSDVEPA